MQTLTKKIDASRLAPSILKRLPSFAVTVDALADNLGEVHLSNGAHAAVKLPHHTHLRPGEVLLDDKGFMVRLTAAPQAALQLTHAHSGALAQLALSLANQGWAVSVNGDALLTPFNAALQDWADQHGFSASATEAAIEPTQFALPAAPDCGHGHSHSHDAHGTHDHDNHDHAHHGHHHH